MKEHRNTNNHLYFEFEKIKNNTYKEITNLVVKKFELSPENELVVGLDEILQNFKSGEAIIGLEWDIWSGYIVVAQNKESESLATEVANYINENN